MGCDNQIVFNQMQNTKGWWQPFFPLLLSLCKAGSLRLKGRLEAGWTPSGLDSFHYLGYSGLPKQSAQLPIPVSQKVKVEESAFCFFA